MAYSPPGTVRLGSEVMGKWWHVYRESYLRKACDLIGGNECISVNGLALDGGVGAFFD